MKTLVIYPGTFDPVTRGHVDLIRRCCEHFSKMIVAVAEHTHKKAFFSLPERVQMMKEATQVLPRVEVDSFSGLLVDYMRSRRVNVALRGLRAVSDFEYEFQLAQMNRKLYREFEIIYMMPDEKYTYISSSLVKEVAALGGDVSEFVPEEIRPFLMAKFVKAD
ncbi:pantetheine-phosphate adenylyltransferase [candidate division FCPU426 bacterium]|nr:pantetheine-phosphate adenylyltransferase [candidate division FCPU426 bacterium]